MKHYILCLLICIIESSLPASAQEYSYHQYTTKDGLAAETIYNIIQDRQGFLWIGTENGLSRFNGQTFKNFSIADGLPSGEVLGCVEDSENRIWIISFSRHLCYYKEGKIYNQYNDSLLSEIRFEREIKGMLEDRLKRILVWDVSGKVYIIDKKKVIQHATADSCKLDLSLMIAGSGVDFSILAMPQEIERHVKKYFLRFSIPDNSIYVSKIDNNVVLFSGRGKAIFLHTDTRNFFELDHEKNARFYKAWDENYIVESIIGKTGVFLYNYKTGVKKSIFPNTSIVNSIFRDRDHNLWFSTKGNGLFRLNNTTVLNVSLGNKALPIRFVLGNEKGIRVGTENDECWYIDPVKDSITGAAIPQFKQRQFVLTKNWLKKNACYAPLRMHHDFFHNDEIGHVKSTYAFDEKMLVASSAGAFIFSFLNDSQYYKRKIYSRATTAIRQGNYYYIGTLEGLVILDKEYHFVSRLSTYPITHITPGENDVLWIATHGHGVLGIKDHKIIARINKGNCGLGSNLCINIHAAGKALWIATNKGLNQVLLDQYLKPRVKRLFNTTNGLNSDEVTAVFVRDTTVWVGTQKGLNVIVGDNNYRPAVINLQLTAITVADKILSLNDPVTIPHDSNRIRFDFSALLFSAEQVTYHYRILGLHNNWVQTEEPVLSFLSLPSGAYTLQLKAVSALGQESPLIEKKFRVEQTLYETWWFRVLIILAFCTLVFLFLKYRIRKIRRQEAVKSDLVRKVTELEQMALRAQMNPHFIFNCLNSVQNYIVRKDSMGASLYLSRFATLIRKTLDNAGSLYIPLREELAYLESYIALEKLQANHAFVYIIEVAPSVNTVTTAFPNMILQPFVENAIKHGMQYAGPDACLTINFVLKDEKNIMCSIEDNGPGIYTAKKTTATHHSKGMEITQQRVATLNQLNDLAAPITLLIEDLAAGGSTGTRVIITVPVKAI